MDAYRDEGMGDVIVGEPFLKEVRIKARRFGGMITIYNGNKEVTYQMVRSHPRFKHHTYEHCNKIPPLLKNSSYLGLWKKYRLSLKNDMPSRDKRMIPEPGDLNREVPVNETFHVQTDDELIEKELKQIEADDQAIQTIHLGLPEDIYAVVDSLLHQDQPSFNQNYMQQPMPNPKDITYPTTAMNMALALMAKAFKINYSTPTNNNQRISSNPHNRQIAQPGMNMGQDRQMQMVRGNGGNQFRQQIAQPGMNMGQDRQMQMVRGNGGNQFRQYAGQNVGNLNRYNDVQNVGNQVIHHAVQNPRTQNVGNQNGLIGVPGNVNQNPNGNGNLVVARAEGNATGHNGNQIRCYNCRGVGYFARNCTVRPRRKDAAYLQTQLLIAQKEEAGIQLQAKEFDLMAAVADLDEIEEVNANCILMAYLQQASTLGTQTDKAPIYDSDRSAEVNQIWLWCVDSGCSKHMTGNLQLLINFVWKFLGTVRFGNDHVATILGFGDLQWGNILITRVYFVEGLGHNLFSVGQFCNSNLEVAFRRNACFIKNIKGVYLLKGNRSTNLYAINLHEMASASPICLKARASLTKSWLWHQRLSHLNFDTINDLAKNDLVLGLPKVKYHKEHLCSSCEQGKKQKSISSTQTCSKFKAEVTPSSYGFVSKDEAPEVIKTLLKRINVLFQSPVIIIRTDNGTEFKNQVLKEYLNCVGISHQISSVRTPQQNRVVERRNWTLVEAARTMKLGAKDDIGFFIGYSVDSSAYRIYNRRTKKIMETMNVSFDELLAMAFEQCTMYDDYIGGQPSSAQRTVLSAQAHQQQGTETLILPKTVADNVPNAMFDANTFVNPFATSSTSAAESSSSQYVDPSNMHTFYQPYPREFQWSKDHPLEQVIEEPSRPVLTRNQLRSDGDMCILL
nr:integrase, catalytic region, zinc finger, CCHC-type, peptidase aspartic, catalytic [Tanacetum cinerariifolium]